MINDYYKLPLQLNKITEKRELQKCSLYDSISDMVHLIAITCFGECKHDESFGCEIWEHDFENITNSQKYKEKLITSIKATLKKQEPRLSNINVDIQIEQIDYMLKQRRIKSRIKMKVTGKLTSTNESFLHYDEFFIGPLSYY